MELVILVPVLGRPQNVAPLAESIKVSTASEHRLLWLCSPGDDEEIAACRATYGEVMVMPWEPGRADFARKIGYGFMHTSEPWLFQAADDLRFSPLWDVHALAVADHKNRGVIGTNDLGNPSVKRGTHSTHTLFSRTYIETHGGTVDRSGIVFSEAYDHQWCNPPEAPIWMADLSFRSLGEVKVGDKVMGWYRPEQNPSDPEVMAAIREAEGSNREIAEAFTVSATHVQAIKNGLERAPGARRWKAPLRRLCESEVLAVASRRAPLVSVTMASGRVLRCTPDHRWLNARWSPSTPRDSQWVTAEPGRTLLHVMDQPPEVPPGLERLAGWVGGIYDGEGSGIYVVMQSALQNQRVIDEAHRAFAALEIPYRFEKRKEKEMVTFILVGGRQAYLNYLTQINPVRGDKIAAKILGSARFGGRDKVVSVEPDGEGDVISMTTSTGNYTAWGYASKNCDNEFIETAKARGQFAFCRRAVVEHLHPHWGKSKMDATYEKAVANSRKDRELFAQRMRLVRTPEMRRERQQAKRVERLARRKMPR